jgi:uncharacterized membrane protein
VDEGGGAGDTARRRVVFVDLLRAIAAFQMVQGHTVDAVLSTHYRAGVIHDAWSFTRGLTAVAFLVAAGLAFEITTLDRFERHKANHAAVLRRFRRAAFLVVLGYLLHFPNGMFFAGDLQSWNLAARGFFVVDILQCIGITLLFMESLVVLLARPYQVTLVSALVAAGVLVATPWCASIDVPGPWRAVTNYLNRQGGSVFPLLPWSAHMLSGVVIGRLLRARGTAGESVKRLAVIGFLLLVFSWAIGVLVGRGVVSDHLARLGWVVLACGVLGHVARFISRVPGWLSMVAGETLVIYVFHILLVYGYGIGLASLIGPTLHPVGAVLTAALVVVASYVAIPVYRHIRRRSVANAVPTG